MREDEYRRLDEVDESLWWLVGLRQLILALIARHGPGQHFTLLDAGCGTGGMLKRIGAAFPQAELHGLDYAEDACAFARQKTGAAIRSGSVSALPYPDASFDVLVSLDVLGSDNLKPAQVIGEFRRVLRPGGVLILNLAAYQWLLSYHDRAVNQTRRFTAVGVRNLLEAARLTVLRISYWNTLLFPLMVLRRKVWPDGTGESDVQALPPSVNALFSWPLALERALLGRGIALPFGGSVIGVARKES